MSSMGSVRTRRPTVAVRRRDPGDPAILSISREPSTNNNRTSSPPSTFTNLKTKSTPTVVFFDDVNAANNDQSSVVPSQLNHVRTVYMMGTPSPLAEESLPEKDNTSKLATLWEDKIHGSDEKGVRKATAVDIPDEIIVHARSQEKTGPVNVTFGIRSKSVSGHLNPNISPSTITVLKSTSKPSSSSPPSPSVNMRDKVQAFERLASSTTNKSSMSDRITSMATSPTISTQLGVGLRPINSDVSRRPSESIIHLNRRLSSLPDSVDTSVEELHRKVERMQLRITQLERQLASVEQKCAEHCH